MIYYLVNINLMDFKPRNHYLIFLNAVQEEAEEASKTLEADISKTQSEMNELKTVLYAKFGNSINLEA